MERFKQIRQKLLFYQQSQPFYQVMLKGTDNLVFAQGVNFEFLDSFKNNGTKYLLPFDDSCGGICNSKAIVDIPSAGKHRGSSAFYTQHNLFYQSKLGREVDL